ncbi:hypothetical protein P7C70_g7341, partial [Phenoliferia sp. Uapishka_3]
MSTSRVIPAFKSRSVRLAPAKLALFRSIVAHPPAPFASTSTNPNQQQDANSTPPAMGPHQVIFTTSPRHLIPLTNSPTNHRLWNPPAADAKGSRVVERDESGRLAKFESRFKGVESDQAEGQKKQAEMGQFDPEADLSFLEGETLQSPDRPLGKKDVVSVHIFWDMRGKKLLMIIICSGPSKSTKKGKK